MSIFSNKKVYETSWSLKNSRGFSADEIAEVENAVVVESSEGYGNSCCFMLRAGGKVYIPMSKDATVGVGEAVDLNKAQILTLCKPGENDIERIQI